MLMYILAPIRSTSCLFQLFDDPIFVDISELEQKPDTDEAETFRQFIKEMKQGKTGSKRIEQADRALPKGDFQDGVKYIKTPVTYFYSGIPDSSYSFAFSFTDSDLKYRRPAKPVQLPLNERSPMNFYGYMRSYNDSYVYKVCTALYNGPSTSTCGRVN